MLHPSPNTVSLTTNDSLLACEPPYEDGSLPLVLLYSTVFVVGLPANLLTVYLTWLQVRRRNVLGVFLWSLSLCDLTYLLTLPLWAIYFSRGHLWPWSSASCKLTGYVFFTNMYISIFLLSCISCDRYVAVAYALESRGVRRLRLAVLATLGIILLVSVIHVPVFLMKEGEAAQGNRRCFEPSWGRAVVSGFSYARFVVGFLLPLLLLIVTNRGIMAAVKRSSGLRWEQKRHVQRLAMAVVLLFLVCFAPYHVLLLLRAIAPHFPLLNNCTFKRTVYTAYTICLGLSTVNSAVNPVLYVLSSKNIRKELSQGITRICSREPRPRPDWNNIQINRNPDPNTDKNAESQQGADPQGTSRTQNNTTLIIKVPPNLQGPERPGPYASELTL